MDGLEDKISLENYYKIRKKLLSVFSSFLVLALGLTAGISLLGQNQDIREKAATEEIVEQGTGNKLTVYKAVQFGYALTFNPRVWETKSDLEQDNQEIVFNLRSDGPATVKISAYPLQEPFLQASLDTLVNTILEGRTDQTTRLTNVEKITRNNREYSKLTFKEDFLSVDTEYYQYVTLQNSMYYVIESKYSQLEPAPTLTQSLVDSLRFSDWNRGNVQGKFTNGEGRELSARQVAEIAKPSVVNIIHLYCTKLIAQTTVKFLQPEYDVCGASKGTGFIITRAGHIATNGHVVKKYPEGALASSLTNKDSQFPKELVQEITYREEGKSISSDEAQYILAKASDNPSTFNSLLQLSYGLLEQGVISLEKTRSKYLVNLGGEVVEIDWEKALSGALLASPPLGKGVEEAELIDFDYPNQRSIDSVLRNQVPVGSDIGLLKVISAPYLTFPALNLVSSNQVKEGEEIVVIGYPTLVEGSDNPRIAVSYASSVSQTVTRGIVSALKTDQVGSKLIQTDASIEHGNSGGPAFNQKGEVIGIATYVIPSESGNYNFLRSTDDLFKLTSKFALELNDSLATANWLEGLSKVWNDSYSQAIPLFEEAKALYPVSPVYEQYIADSQKAIKLGKEKNMLLNLIPASIPVIVFLVLSGLVIGVIITLLLLPPKFVLGIINTYRTRQIS